MSETKQKLVTDKSTPGHWRVTLNNPPINVIDDGMYDAFYDLVGEIEASPTLKVVTFESANPDFFLAHYSSAEPRSRFGVPRWIEASGRLAASGVLSIAVIRGRVRGGGCEFAMGLDIRFASREKAIFGQPEVGTGLIPGGGALQRLPLLVGRARTLEIVLGGDDYDAETAERYGWINRAIPDTDLDAFVGNFVRRVVSSTARRYPPPSRSSTRRDFPIPPNCRPRKTSSSRPSVGTALGSALPYCAIGASDRQATSNSDSGTTSRT
jgi:enoyl-CoA hydratase/carnithine racemase